MLVATLNQPLSRGEVTLKGRDVEIDHKYLQEELDLRMYVAICKEAMALTQRLRDVEVLIPKVPGNRARSHRFSYSCIFMHFHAFSSIFYGSELLSWAQDLAV